MGGLLEGRRALITGAASGIGAAIARRFGEEGAAVVLTDRDFAAVEPLAGELRERGVDAHARGLDVTDDAAVARVLDESASSGGLDTVVANAGELALGHVERTPVEELDRLLRVNVLGAWSTLRHAIPHVRAAGDGVLLVTTSLAARRGSAELGAYAASKSALTGLVQALASELAAEGVRVCAVAPGFVETGMTLSFGRARAEIRGRTADEALDEVRAGIPMGRLGRPEEVADAFVFLASPLARYVTGATLTVSGGA